MNETGFALFDSPIGACAIAWGPRGVVGVQLPESSEAATRARIAQRFPALRELAPPTTVERAMTAIRLSLEGAQVDLREIELDLEGIGEFQRRVYEVARAIPPGRTRSYGDIAEQLGDKGLARAVGQALGSNPFAPVVPCHRVLAARGRPGGFSAHGGAAAKLRMLAIEGARPPGDTPQLF